MTSASDLASLAALLADETRAAICLALLDGRAWTAGELAVHADVAPSTATGHLHRLVDGGLLTELRQGRHRYVRLANPSVAHLIEDLSARTESRPTPVRGLRAATANTALRRGRTCYDHLAGRLGVAVTDAMTSAGLLDQTGGFALTAAGLSWLTDNLALSPAELRPGQRPLARGCLDWTERRQHLAGLAGARLCETFLANGWIVRIGSGRAVRLTKTERPPSENSWDCPASIDGYTQPTITYRRCAPKPTNDHPDHVPPEAVHRRLPGRDEASGRLPGGVNAGALRVQVAGRAGAVLKAGLRAHPNHLDEMLRAQRVVEHMRSRGYSTPDWLAMGATATHVRHLMDFVDAAPMPVLTPSLVEQLLEIIELQAGRASEPYDHWSYAWRCTFQDPLDDVRRRLWTRILALVGWDAAAVLTATQILLMLEVPIRHGHHDVVRGVVKRGHRALDERNAFR